MMMMVISINWLLRTTRFRRASPHDPLRSVGPRNDNVDDDDADDNYDHNNGNNDDDDNNN